MNKSGEVKQSPSLRSSTPIPSLLGSCLRDASPLAKAVYTAIQLRHCRNPRPAFLEMIAQTLQGALKRDGYGAKLCHLALSVQENIQAGVWERFLPFFFFSGLTLALIE